MNNEINILSYGQFLKDSLNFRRSGTYNDVNEFNIYDFPSHKYFKILFYFGNIGEKSNVYGEANGLLHPTWNLFKQEKSESYDVGGGIKTSNPFSTPASALNEQNKPTNTIPYYEYNSAWSYLKLNDENERAEKLEKFVTLLSNINCYSPWYFTSIGGIDTALERKGPDDKEVKFDETKKFTITCMPDSFDNRIGTLLELYRDIVWSWQNKKEIIPSNLRKFDMALYIFESPVHFWHDYDKEHDTSLENNDNYYKPSYKMLEFHDCEFSYNSIKSGFSDVNNQTGFKPTYTIEISYNDCYEISYNEHIMREIGDIIETDIYQALSESNISFESTEQKDNYTQKIETDKRSNAIFNSGDMEKLNDFSFLPKIKKSKNGSEKTYTHKDIYSFGQLEMRDNQTYKSNYEVDENGNPKSPRKLHENLVLENDLPGKKGFLGNAIENLAYGAKQGLDNVLYNNFGFTTNINGALLGNLYTVSLTKIGSQFEEALKGNLIKAGQSVKEYADMIKESINDKKGEIPLTGNLGTGYETYNEQNPSGELFDSTPRSFKGIGRSLGNLANRLAPSSIANN